MNHIPKATFVVNKDGKPQRVLINGVDVCAGALLTHAGFECGADGAFDLRLTFAVSGIETVIEGERIIQQCPFAANYFDHMKRCLLPKGHEGGHVFPEV
jgi:hypothetical protein